MAVFQSYFAINKIIFDYLQAEKDVQLDSTVVQALSRLLDVKPEYDWTPLNWYVNPDLPDNVINQQPSSVIADLMGVMEHIITEGEEEAYQSEIQYQKTHKASLNDSLRVLKDGENLNFISSILRMIALMALIIIAILRSRIVESIILGSAVMDEYKFVNPSAPTSMCKSIIFATGLPGSNSIPATHFATKLGRQGCRRKTKTRRPNDRVDYNNFNRDGTFGNSLHDIQEVSLRFLITKGMLPLVPIQHDTPRHRTH